MLLLVRFLFLHCRNFFATKRFNRRLDTAKAPCLSVKSQASPDNFSSSQNPPLFMSSTPSSELSLLIQIDFYASNPIKTPLLVLQPRRFPTSQGAPGVPRCPSVSLQRFSRCMCCWRLVRLASKSAASVSTWDSPMGQHSPWDTLWETYKKRHRKWP